MKKTSSTTGVVSLICLIVLILLVKGYNNLKDEKKIKLSMDTFIGKKLDSLSCGTTTSFIINSEYIIPKIISKEKIKLGDFYYIIITTKKKGEYLLDNLQTHYNFQMQIVQISRYKMQVSIKKNCGDNINPVPLN